MGLTSVIIRYNKKHPMDDAELYNRIWEDPDMLVYSEKQIYELLVGYNKYLGDIVTGTRDGVIMPLYMGIMLAGTYGDKNKPVMKNTLRDEKPREHRNDHTDGYGGMIYYITAKTDHKFGLGKFWGFKPTGYWTKKLQEGYKTDWKKYVNVPNSKDMYKMFRKKKNIEFAKGESAERLKEYDEFDFNV